jgi:hypothetical protein
MILDGLNCFSSISAGDSPTAMTDNASTNSIDQGVKGLAGFRGEGGAYVAPFLIVKVSHDTAFTTGSAATIQIALQDAANTSATDETPYWTGAADILVGNVFTAAQAAADVILLANRIPTNHRRHLRLVYRIGTGTMTAGALIGFLTLDKDVIDQAMRHTTFAAFSQAGQISEAVANGVLDS